MRRDGSDCGIARAGLMGRDKAKEVREIAVKRGWLDRTVALPEDAELAEVFGSGKRPPTRSTVERCGSLHFGASRATVSSCGQNPRE